MIRQCSTCEWYRRIDSDVGTCRGALPVMLTEDDGGATQPYGAWPTVEPSDVCASHTFPRRSWWDELRLAVQVAVERRVTRPRQPV